MLLTGKYAYNESMDKSKKKIISCILVVAGIFFIAAYLWLTFGDRLGQAVSAPGSASETEGQADPGSVSGTEGQTDPGPPESAPQETEETSQETVPETSPQPELTENPYKDYFLQNEDMAAWLYVDGTRMDYPVMWTPRDEEYYLLKDFEGNYDKNGCLILDTDSSLDPVTTNLIIHGHNMRSGAMFGDLMDYEDEEFARDHAVMLLYTPEGIRTYEVLAAFYSQVYKKTDEVFKFYKFFQADTQEEFDDFYDNIRELSLYDTGVTAEFGDRFLTLSTCAYHVENGRFVVVAKEVSYEECYLPIEGR